jgi:hypothetical protein
VPQRLYDAHVQAPSGAPSWLEAFTAAERPDLWSLARDGRLFDGLWPEYNHHGNHTGRYFGSLHPRHADSQVLFADRRSGRLIARGRTIPFHWDGTLETLPAGIDALGLQAISEPHRPTALSALAAEVAAGYQGSGLSRRPAVRPVAARACPPGSPDPSPGAPVAGDHSPDIRLGDVDTDGIPR